MSIDQTVSPMEQLIGFVEWERKNNPGKTHIADWAAAEIERQAFRITALEAALRAFLATDPSFTRGPLQIVEDLVAEGNELAPVVLQARRALGES